MPIHAVICDLDGTLVDSERIFIEASRAVVAPGVITTEVYESWIGRGGFSEWVERQHE